ncbi:hypothetical protein [Paenibacillus sanguinis]|uniref:hypothetical protein n=1 Tax=Paenibacillus sanguinis TaxID=225906 RepID=UPI00037CF126|nr:hypothetical protein [Paenibacillus sanguinis]
MIDSHVDANIINEELFFKEVCTTAIKQGVKGLTFCHTLEDKNINKSKEFFINFNESNNFLYQQKLMYYGELNFFKGIELISDLSNIEEFLRIINLYQFDYIKVSINPIHFSDSEKLQREIESLRFLKYFNSVCQVEPLADWIYSGKKSFRSYKVDLLDELLKKLINSYKSIELNTNLLRKESLGENIYSLLKRYRKLGGNLICLSSRTKTVEKVCCNFAVYRELLVQLGFKYTTHYINLTPTHDSLR